MRLTQAHSQLSQRLVELKALFPLDAATHLPILSTLAGQTVHDGGATSLLDLKLSIDWRQAARGHWASRRGQVGKHPGGHPGAGSVWPGWHRPGLDDWQRAGRRGSIVLAGQADGGASTDPAKNASGNPALSIVERIEALFGGGFRALSVFRPGLELKNAIDQRARIGNAGPDALLRWLQAESRRCAPPRRGWRQC